MAPSRPRELGCRSSIYRAGQSFGSNPHGRFNNRRRGAPPDISRVGPPGTSHRHPRTGRSRHTVCTSLPRARPYPRNITHLSCRPQMAHAVLELFGHTTEDSPPPALRRSLCVGPVILRFPQLFHKVHPWEDRTRSTISSPHHLSTLFLSSECAVLGFLSNLNR